MPSKTSPKINSYGLSHVGMVRSNNEDSFVTEPELGLFVVADGMGGAQAGERASRIAVETLVSEIQRAGDDANAESLTRAVQKANQNVRREAAENPQYAGMGTTVVAVLLRLPKVYVVNVGDSRAYLRTGGELYCVTSDHTWVHEVGRGLGLTDEQLRTHPYRNVLTKAVGSEEQIDIEGQEIEYTPGDLLLLSSDGLHNVAGEAALLDVLARTDSLEKKCEALIAAALKKGAPDNATAVLVEYQESPQANSPESGE